MYWAIIKEEKLKYEAEKFRFDGSCPNCKENITEFISGNKKIFLCEHCGCIYLPEDMRNTKLHTYKYQRLKGVFIPVCRKPTELQLDYLKYLADETETRIDFDIVTREEAKLLINELGNKVKEKPFRKNMFHPKKEPEKEIVYDLDAMDEEYAMNHPFII